MQRQDVDQIVNDILIDMSKREKDATPRAESSSVPEFEDAFKDLLQEDDETSLIVMRKIWRELQAVHHRGR